MHYTLGDLASRVGGVLHGDSQLKVTGADIIRDVESGQITLAESQELADSLVDCRAAAAVVPAGCQPSGIDFIAVNDVHGAFAKIVQLYRPQVSAARIGISPAAHVSPTAKLADQIAIHPGATIGDDVVVGKGCVVHPGVHVMSGCRLGENVTLFPNVVLYENTTVGQRVLIHAGAVIGCYGFGYATRDGRHQLSAQLGAVVIGDDVEIGAGTTVDRGTYGNTVIGEGTKIDNQVQVAHNCRIGRHNLLCAQVGIAGSCTTGDFVVMAGQAGLRDHIHIGDQAVLAAKCGVMNSVPDGEVYMGIPAGPGRQQKMRHIAIGKLPELRKDFKELEKRVRELEQRSQREAA